MPNALQAATVHITFFIAFLSMTNQPSLPDIHPSLNSVTCRITWKMVTSALRWHTLSDPPSNRQGRKQPGQEKQFGTLNPSPRMKCVVININTFYVLSLNPFIKGVLPTKDALHSNKLKSIRSITLD